MYPQVQQNALPHGQPDHRETRARVQSISIAPCGGSPHA
jgi:hypothetical protein